MDRDEFMELVYETFADEPDNVLANGIIEAADAYVEHEKAQHSSEDTTKDTTSDLISKTEVVKHLRRMLESTVPNTDYDEGFVDGVEFGISTVSTMPTIQPVATDTNVGDTISRQAAIDRFNVIRPVDPKKDEYTKGIDVGIAMCIVAVKDQPSAQPEPDWIPVSERLPKTGVEVLTYDEALNYIEIQTVSDGRWENQRGDWQDLDDIAAWMPLPEAYKGDEK